jgi:pimeloyl-ACP methyl ester carboxylesterase
MSENTASTLVAPRLSVWSAAREATGFLELPRLALGLRALRGEPRGDGGRVIVLPGFGADDRSTWPLRRFLRSLGHDARGWRRGPNVGDVAQSVDLVGQMAREGAEASGRPVALVGWSLGGYLAREVARDHPDCVRRVVTLGSPVIGGPKYTTVASVAPLRGWDLDEIEAQVELRKATPLEVPVTAIYSRRDRVVAWRACVDPEGDGPIEHVEVEATHIGLGFSPEVYRLVARRLGA